MTKYSLDKVCTGDHKADLVNSRIMELAEDIVEKEVERECKENNIVCYHQRIEDETTVMTYTEEAQEIFNELYDAQVDFLYNFVNEIIEIDRK